MNHKQNSILSLEDLSVTYKTHDGPIIAVQNVSIELKQNETIGIIGESGSGKTTLAYSIMGYHAKNASCSGRVVYRGTNLLEMSSRELQQCRGNNIAMVYQNPYSSLNPSLTIGRQLNEVSLCHRNVTAAEAEEDSIAMLMDLHIGDAAGIVKRYPHQISGGMQQRICIAMALLCRPDILIMDEPTTALDVTTEAVILDLVAALGKRYNISLIYISHDIGIVNKVSDKLVVMYRGEIVETGPNKKIFARPEHPYTRALINCMPRSGIVKNEYKLNTIPGYVKKRQADLSPCPFADRCEKITADCQDNYGMHEREDEHFSTCNRAYAGDEVYLAPKKASPNNQKGHDLLRIEDLYKQYRNKNRRTYALNGLSVTVQSNSVLGIVGESGCGKSTLGYNIAGLLTPTSGRILFDDVDIGFTWKKRSRDILREIQLIFQNPGRSLNPSFTVERIIGNPMKRLLGIRSRAERRVEITKILQKVDLSKDYLSRKVTRLSGGEMQRIAVARAFAIAPNLIICDEPTSALDVSVQASVLNLLSDLQSESGIAYIFISHDLHVIDYISDYIMVMYLGKICEYGRREEVTSPPYHPYTEALLSAIPEVDPSLEKETILLESNPPNPTKKITGCPFADRCHKKIGSICDTTAPPRVDISPDHFLHCHLPVEELQMSNPPS